MGERLRCHQGGSFIFYFVVWRVGSCRYRLVLVENVWSGDSRWNASLRITRGTVISNRSAFKGKTISIEFTVPGKGGWLQYYSEKKIRGVYLRVALDYRIPVLSNTFIIIPFPLIVRNKELRSLRELRARTGWRDDSRYHGY